MVLDLVRRVAPQPGEITVGGHWPVVDEPALPSGIVKAIEDDRAELSGHFQLSQDLVKSLVGVAAQVHALVSVHARAAWPVLNLGQNCAVPLNEQHVPYVADVFMSGPHVRIWPATGRIRRSTGQRRTVTAGPRSQPPGDLADSQRFIAKAALLAGLHLAIMARSAGSRGPPGQVCGRYAIRRTLRR